MLAQVTYPTRSVPVPRRLLRFIAGGGQRVRLATILRHCLRCLFSRQDHGYAEGFCKASRTWASSGPSRLRSSGTAGKEGSRSACV
jgi:hypothetical protein